jgi:hypothetical protein
LFETRERRIVKVAMEAMPEIGEKAEGIGPLGPVFTLGTANSACFVGFYARISGIRENPLKYMDLDGNEEMIFLLLSDGHSQNKSNTSPKE